MVCRYGMRGGVLPLFVSLVGLYVYGMVRDFLLILFCFWGRGFLFLSLFRSFSFSQVA